MKSNNLKKPKPSVGDVVHTGAKTIISAIPYVGGPLVEIFNAVIIPPLTKRRDEWIESIVKHLQELEEKIEGFKIEDLSYNAIFVTTIMQATQAAIRNHQEEKLEALRNAVLNSALPNAPEEDLQFMFLNFVDTLTPWHLRILKFLDGPRKWGEVNGIVYPNWFMGAPSTVLEHAFPELAKRADFYVQIAKDLFARGLSNTESLGGNMTVEGMFSSRTTNIGKLFLNFIATPLQDKPT